MFNVVNATIDKKKKLQKSREKRLKHTMRSTVQLKISNSRSRSASTQAKKKKLRYFRPTIVFGFTALFPLC